MSWHTLSAFGVIILLSERAFSDKLLDFVKNPQYQNFTTAISDVFQKYWKLLIRILVDLQCRMGLHITKQKVSQPVAKF